MQSAISFPHETPSLFSPNVKKDDVDQQQKEATTCMANIKPQWFSSVDR
jgi:hypothetical protein